MTSSPRVQHPPLLLLAAVMMLALRASAQSTASPVVRFRQDGVCPPTSVPASQLLQGASSQRSCSVECALSSDCAVFGFNSSSSECRMGSTADLITSWLPPANPATSCVSQLNPRLPGVLSFRSSLLAYLDFRISRDNLVSSARFSVTGSSPGVTFDSSGAVFPPVAGSVSNYVELNTIAGAGAEAFGDLLGRDRNFSVFARVYCRDNKTQLFYMTTGCSDYGSFRGGFGYMGGLVVMGHALSSPNELNLYVSNETVTQITGQITAVSAGIAFDGSRFTAAYYNGKSLGVGNLSISNPPSYSGLPECLRLGFSGEAKDSLVGRFVCFAIVRRALSAQEFAELDALCA